MRHKPWTIKEQTTLQQHWYTASDAQLLKMLPERTWCAISTKALTLGLHERYKVQRGTKPLFEVMK